MASFHCSVVTPERVVLETEARFAAFPAHDGEIGILPGRAPLLVALGVGRLRVQSNEGEQVLLVDGGFAEMSGDTLTVLTEQAQRPEEIEPGVPEQELERARQMPLGTDVEFAARQRALARARAARRMAR